MQQAIINKAGGKTTDEAEMEEGHCPSGKRDDKKLEEGDPTDRFKGTAKDLEPKKKPTAVEAAKKRLKRAEEKLKKDPDNKDLKKRVDSAKAALKRALKKAGLPDTVKEAEEADENLNESFTSKKDQLLFERLVKKWTK